MTDKKRLDIAIFELGLCESREKAKALIMAGQVYVNGQKEIKAGFCVKGEENIEVRGSKMPYVSRGGLKLEKAMKSFNIALDSLICMDVGASTGGFTDCMLQNGAIKVYAIDVGYGQLAWKLRNDEKVVNLERTNFRYVTKEQVPEPVDFASVDVAFISLKLILPVLNSLLKNNGKSVCLIKPQFEAGREKVGKKGVVKEFETHLEVVQNIIEFTLSSGYSLLGIDFSPIKGPEGNIEYLMYIEKSNNPSFNSDEDVYELIKRSHENLNGGE